MRIFGVVVGLIILIIVLAFCMNTGYKKQIKNKVESVGGELISVKAKSAFEEDPFAWYEHGKNVYFYKFRYFSSDGEIVTGWVKFALINRWIMDERGS